MHLSHETQADAVSFPQATPEAGPWLVRRLLRHLECGRLTVILPSGERIAHVGRWAGPHGVMELRNLRALRRLLTRGDVGFAEGFIAGDWSSPDLTALIAMAAENVSRLDRTTDGFWPVRLWRQLGHALKRNSANGSRRNIAFHYDLGNDFYRLWLDESMTYSSACRIAPGQSLEAAQGEKLDRIAELLSLGGDEDVLEIGCGWGALAARLAEQSRSVTGLTLSVEQLAYAREQFASTSLSDRVDLRLQDYREEQARYDRIVSIEMLEAVGESYWPAYFGKLRDCLRPGGRVVLQAITIREDRFNSYKRSPDFIQRYIFPGGMLPTQAILADQAERAGFAVATSETFGEGYADTLAEWRGRFDAAWPKVAALGFDADFRRLWDYYLSYCEAGFRTGTIDVGLYVLEPT
ncbi:class I SAM-dependent methyltransferase [Sphingomonas sp. CGMCC 1.13654]|uniref:Class I SAM-dependent methyltransferase n=1 Tax=Sphingomonas chungangi TaxID=2683589 RepID=A0A838L2K9_9SPHN|nr:cyclopropane-fatty-acyl-phospholipid synthase family protein [Sphingomonas chungangi]MBA2932885.1 class I SAM-dependent methyltransferase [Sphingomonas chungangi]MVW56505.1 methyltransferase domain-containing protein [Sphingomonas chungangi]